jgi:DNA-binding response OmpR family regulator
LASGLHGWREVSVRILVADDDVEMRRMLCAVLRRSGFQVEAAEDGHAVRARLESAAAKPDIIITDLRMPGWSGFHVLEWTRRSLPRARVILITAFGDEQTHRRAAALGAAAVFDKPFNCEELLDAIGGLVGR